jgi:hypothetical protein
MSEYTEKADKFLADAGLEFRAVLVGNDCPAYCSDAEKDIDMDKLDIYPRRTHIHGKHYRCTISRKDRGHVSFDFWNSYSDSEFNYIHANWFNRSYPSVLLKKHGFSDSSYLPIAKGHKGPKNPTAYDLLACITKNDPGTFEWFCSDYGYNTDSRKAEDSYRAVVKEYAKVRKFFTDAELEQLQDIQ